MPLIVYSNSTKEFARSMKGEFFEVKAPPTEKTLKFVTDDEVIAIGGGSVIDTAKIMAINSKCQRVTAIPTTAAGAAVTGHAVYWENNRKYSIGTPTPEVRIVPELLESLPDDVIRATSYDALSQAFEAIWSKRATAISNILAQRAIDIVSTQMANGYLDLVELIRGGNLSGQAINITGTNIVHAISYPLTGFYDIPHGVAVGLILPEIARYIEDRIVAPKYGMEISLPDGLDFIASEAMGYAQVHDTKRPITKDAILGILRRSL